MSISNGQPVNAAASNAAWVSKTADSTVTGKITLARALSGATITDTQQKINDLETDLSTKIDLAEKGSPNGVATLDATGRIPSSQLTIEVFEYVGTWDASTNTPTLADGVGSVGDVYKVTASGSQDLGSGSIFFDVGDQVVYNNAGVWEKWDVNDLFTVVDDAATGSNVTLTAIPNDYVVRLTNASLVSVDMIPAAADGSKAIIINRTGGDVDINNDVGATAANRILTGTGADLTLADNAALWFLYDATTLRWQVTGGSGGNSQVGFQETPGGTVNGINDTFGPLTYLPTSEDSILVMLDGLVIDKTAWSLSGSNIIFSLAPSTGQTVYVYYLTEGSPSLPSISGILKTEYRTLSSGESSAESLTLVQTPVAPTEVQLDVIGGGPQFYGDAFSVSGTTLSWSGLALDGILTTGDKLRIVYVY